MTPSRMKSCRLIDVAMNSIAQQARPKLNTHREYRRPQLSTNFIGLGASRESGPTLGGGRSIALTQGIVAAVADLARVPIKEVSSRTCQNAPETGDYGGPVRPRTGRPSCPRRLGQPPEKPGRRT